MHHPAWIIVALVVVLAAVLAVVLVRRARLRRWIRARAEETRQRRESLLTTLARYDPWDWRPIRDLHLTALFGSQTYEAFELTVVAGGVYRLEEPHSDEQLYIGCILSHCKRHQGESDKWKRVLEFDPALDPTYDRLIRFHRFMDVIRTEVAVAKTA